MIRSVLLGLCWLFLGCAARSKWLQEISEVTPVPNLAVTIEYKGGAFWRAHVKNSGASAAKLIWDESAYVTTAGKSNRIIRGETRILHSVQAQPPSSIPPEASLTETFTVEMYVRYGVYNLTLCIMV